MMNNIFETPISHVDYINTTFAGGRIMTDEHWVRLIIDVCPFCGTWHFQDLYMTLNPNVYKAKWAPEKVKEIKHGDILGDFDTPCGKKCTVVFTELEEVDIMT
jgi:hypothetical protein